MPAHAYNTAKDSLLTRGMSGIWDRIAEPLADRLFIPLERYNHTIGVAALNGLLTGPRLLAPCIGERYLEHIENGQTSRAFGDITLKAFFEISDGLDGATARRSGLTSEFGVAFDPFADLVGVADDIRIIKRLAKQHGDRLLVSVMNLNLAINATAIIVGGATNKLSTVIAEKRGAKLDDHESAKSLSLGKLKYAGGVVANKLLLGHFAAHDGATASSLRNAGIGMSLASSAIGVASLFQYGSAIANRHHKQN